MDQEEFLQYARASENVPQYNSQNNTRMYSNGLGFGLGNINKITAQMASDTNATKQVVPMLNDGQNAGVAADFNTSPDLQYFKYGGEVAGRLGDLTGSIHGHKEKVTGNPYTSKEYGGSIQYSPQEIQGLIMQADASRKTDNYGLDSNTVGGKLAYNAGNFNASVGGSKTYDTYGRENKNVNVGIGYRW
jgi:hypothetical protein